MYHHDNEKILWDYLGIVVVSMLICLALIGVIQLFI